MKDVVRCFLILGGGILEMIYHMAVKSNQIMCCRNIVLVFGRWACLELLHSPRQGLEKWLD